MGVYYYNNFEDRPAIDNEIRVYNITEAKLNDLNFDDFAFVMDTLKGYRKGSPFYDFDDIIDLSVRFEMSTYELFNFYDIEKIIA